MKSLTQRLPPKLSVPVLAQRIPFEKKASDDWYIGSSDISGQGVFAGKDYEDGDVIGLAMTDGGDDEFGSKIQNLTLLGQYSNHQDNNNVILRKAEGSYSGGYELVASKPISRDDELVSDYRQVTRAIGPNSRMQWEGKTVPSTDFEGYVEQ